MERVLDGDSLLLDCGGAATEVRLHCIDAPERGQIPWGKRARRHLQELAPETVELVKVDTDRFGRVVGDVYAPGPRRRWLNLEQVRDGQAAVYSRYCSDSRFIAAQAEARAAGRGIWSSPGEQQRPWVFRHRESR